MKLFTSFFPTWLAARTAASTLTGTETVPVSQSGTAKKATLDQVKTFTGTGGVGNSFITLADDSTILANEPGNPSTFYLVQTQIDRLYLVDVTGAWRFILLTSLAPPG